VDIYFSLDTFLFYVVSKEEMYSHHPRGIHYMNLGMVEGTVLGDTFFYLDTVPF